MYLNQVATAFYFIFEGQVEVSYKENDDVLLLYENGSYFGDTSLIFGIRNQYSFKLKQQQDPKIYKLDELSVN